MSTTVRVAGFVTALVAVFAAALGVGRTLGPDAAPQATDTRPAHAMDDHGTDEQGTSPATDGATDVPGGLMVSQDGYTMTLGTATARPGDAVPVTFTISGPDGQPVTSYEVVHEKRLHLIAVRRDFTGFQHVHPELSPDGTWSTVLDLTPGDWRIFADFQAVGADALTLGADLAVAGDYVPAASGPQADAVEVDGYTVTLDGSLTPGEDARLTLSVARDGKPVTDLEPYLGAYGHLVALRAGDLAYLHVHPDGSSDDVATASGPEVVFHAAVPTGGTYHLYLDFKHRGTVHTAAFVVA